MSGVPAAAQTSSAASTQPPASATSADHTRPSTATFSGDTGLWFVPTADVLAHGKWSVSGYRASFNPEPGFSNVGLVGGTFAVGIADRVEVFGAMNVDERIDRDIRPIFIHDPRVGGVLASAPFMTTTWSGNQVGDLSIGAKINLLSEARQAPASFAVRGLVKLPTASATQPNGVGTGKPDFELDAVVSKELARVVELSGYGGGLFRGDPSGINLANSFVWGVGAGFPSRSPLRGIVESHGDIPSSHTITLSTPLVATDGSLSPLTSNFPRMTTTTFGVVWQASNGFFIGGGLNWNVPMADRSSYQTDQAVGQARDFLDYQVRIGFHPGAPIYVAPPPPPPPPPPPAPAPAPKPENHAPTVQASCDPCIVLAGQSATVSAKAADPDGDQVTYQWTAPSGTLAQPTAASTRWTAGDQPANVPIQVTVNDGKGGTASATTTIQVVQVTDVHFDFDQSVLKPEATRMLDNAVPALEADKTLNVRIEGHTDNIGTAEYNLALGDRRAKAVAQYLESRGIDASRISTVSYGEEDPKYSNDREETRRLNRRAALIIRVQ
jgi:peptidoglycan-associated lipoprotein